MATRSIVPRQDSEGSIGEATLQWQYGHFVNLLKDGEPVNADTAPFNAGNLTGTVALNFNNGDFQKGAMTGDVTLNAPANGTEGKRLRLWLTPSGANRALDFHVSVLRATDSAITFPKTLTQNKTYVLMLQHNGTAWMLVSLVGGF